MLSEEMRPIFLYGNVFVATFVMITIAAGLSRATHAATACACAATFALTNTEVAPTTKPQFNYQSIAHSPDAAGKWITANAIKNLETLTMASLATNHLGLTIWPENAITHTFSMEQAVRDIDEALFPILFGMTASEPNGEGGYKNIAVLVNSIDDIQVSEKVRLAPISETGIWGGKATDLSAGQRSFLELDDGHKLLTIICYEAVFPLKLAGNEDAIVILAAETGFRSSFATSVMNRHATARSLETGLPVIRVTDQENVLY